MSAHEAHRVVLRDRKRPEKCRAGVQTSGEVADAGLLVPVQLDDALRRNPPLPQMRADAQRDDERRPLGAGQRQHGVHVEVVVMVVADHHRIQGGQRLQRRGHRVQSLRPDGARR